MYKYWGYGLSILSEIEFPELVPFTFEEPDVSIRLGITPKELTGADVVHKVNVSISPTAYLLDIKEVAVYYAAHQNEIIVQPYPGSDAGSIRLFLLGNMMAAILHQRNMIPMHASAIEYKAGIVMFCGRSGVGKSTIISALQKEGYKVFSDDVCVLTFSDGPGSAIKATPSYPMIKLWEDSFEKVGIDAPSDEFKLRPALPKYASYHHDGFNMSPKPVLKVFILNPDSPVEKVEIKQNGNLESFKQLQKNTYRPIQMNAMKKRNLHFSVISQLAGNVPVSTLSRPMHVNSVKQMTALIDSHLKES